MKLSTRTQYGLRMLCQLAVDYDRGPLQMGEIVEREAISEKYLGQIMLVLRSSGLVSSVRGSQGGYFLSRSPDQINLLDAFEVLEGEIFDFDDHADSDSVAEPIGPKAMLASTNSIWNKVRNAIKEVLAKYTLDDVVRLGQFETGYFDFRI
ncbi:MAG: hypothetical protein A2413_15830 [Treponema sp. RIFOXYC1_FULL_61_9]|nr:MAG: hypothetical protein A2Y36_18825 [Treponema sp. GWA1_62_8]OHE63054.1 MAG: hypothetical protein A2001_15465 [Treponema sp. GWC1_61_84]OHE76798.1 MAG: hypothetical protein A2413_15830 [Treponema sp. RIFOXYC1_FULL_61_9]